MAVEVVYRSSRDPERLFMDKAEADRHDKMLELAERLAEVLQKAVPSLTEQQVEEAGIYMAKNRDVFAREEARTDNIKPGSSVKQPLRQHLRHPRR